MHARSGPGTAGAIALTVVLMAASLSALLPGSAAPRGSEPARPVGPRSVDGAFEGASRPIVQERSSPAASASASGDSGPEVGAMATGAGPTGVAYDSANGEIYVVNAGADTVTSYNGSTDRPVSTTAVGSYAQGIAYDPRSDRIFVANSGSHNVTVIDAASGGSIDSVLLPPTTDPYDIAYDSSNGYLYVAESMGYNVVVINGSSDAIVTEVYVGGSPVGVAYDSWNGNVYVSLYGVDNLDIINASDDVVGSVPIGIFPDDVAFDNATGDLYVVNQGSDSVTVVNGSSEKALGTVTVGHSPMAAGFDGSNGDVYVANSGSSNVSVIDGETVRSVGSVRVGTSPDGVGFDPATSRVYVSNSGSANISVLAPPLGASASAAPTTTDVGVAVTLSAESSGGIPPMLSYNWTFGDNGSENSSHAATTHAYGTAGLYGAVVWVTDALGWVASGLTYVTVNASPMASVPTPSRASVDVGQSVSFTTVPSLGTGPYVSFAWTGLPSGCSGETTATVTCPFNAAGTVRVSATVTDSFGVTSVPSAARNFTVFGGPLAQAPSASPASADVDQSVEFSEAPLNGSGGYAYAWGGLPDGCPTFGDPVDCLLTDPGTLSVSVAVTDSNNETSSVSAPLPFTVRQDPAVVLTSDRAVLDLGQSVSWTATGSLGSGSYPEFDWTGLPAGCPGTGATVVCTPGTASSYTVNVTMWDSNRFEAVSAPVTVVVHPALSVPTPAVSPAPRVGGTVTLSVVASGGTPPYAYAWVLGDGTRGVGPTVVHAYPAPATYVVRLYVNDSAGASTSSSVSVIVAAPASGGSPGGPLSGLAGPAGYGIVAGIALAAGVVAVVLLLRRRRRGRGAPPSPDDETA